MENNRGSGAVRGWLSGLVVRSIDNLPSEEEKQEVVEWLEQVREVTDQEILSKTQKVGRINKMMNTGKAARVVVKALSQVAKDYRESRLPLPIKVALPVTLGAAAFVGGQGAGIAALGGAVGVPALLLVFLGSAGLTSVIEAFTTRPETRGPLGTVLALIAHDEALRRARKLHEAMADSPTEPKQAKVSINELALRRQLLKMDPFDFERHVLSFFEAAGMLAWVTPRSNDAGVDGFARHEQGLILVQCKRYSENNPVGRPVVQQLKGVVEENEAWRGYIVTTSRFTEGARDSACLNDKLVLVDMDTLVNWHYEDLMVS